MYVCMALYAGFPLQLKLADFRSKTSKIFGVIAVSNQHTPKIQSKSVSLPRLFGLDQKHYLYISTYVCMYVCMYVCICMYVTMYVTMFLCMYVCMYVCM